ncbi:Glycine betaine/proline betaine transport system, ATP-binding protein [Desulfonema limicola]|uniref:Glycine betaine/proline betaine transport system, ATP-binding protein n=1 Tax=Desulfonema limicola TaxID=45656 RepID=A0A975GH54_9BACT|nr:ABC transporter ATP-binding protein [Desulfonema limicola]QTA80924.1 Glycine betaine/proline betaine transport system, ATP-binding protein [Desulfonema limicola]
MIELERVTKIYPGTSMPAVDNIDLEVPQGEICILIGSSGCGKTTLMRMINRLEPITSGSIKIEGRNVMDMDLIELRRGIGYAIQQTGLFPHMTVAENIMVVPRLLGWDRKRMDDRVDELLKLVNMEPAVYKNRYPRELSGGQAQRIGVTRAMAADPPVMLMDEPFGAIDPINREVLQDEFLKIQAKLKKTIVFVTHDIHEAVKMGDKIALLDAGRLIQYGSPEDLLTRPKNQFVKDFVGADRALKRLDLLKVKDAMMKDPVRCSTDDPSEKIFEHMLAHDLNFLLVTEPGSMFKGYVNIDMLRGHKGIVGDIVHPMTITVRPDQNLKDALSKMLTYDLGIVVAVNEQGQLEGVLNSRTLISVVGETYDETGGHWGKITTGGRVI